MLKNELQGVQLLKGFWFRSCFFQEIATAASIFGLNGKQLLLIDFVNYGKDFHIREEIAPMKAIKYFGLQIQKINISGMPTIVKAIDRGSPVLIGVDTYFYRIRKDLYRKEHRVHFVLVYGYNKETGMLSIVDHDHDTSYRFSKQRVSSEEIFEAEEKYREGMCKKRYTSMLIRKVSSRGDIKNLLSACKENLLEGINNFKEDIRLLEKLLKTGGEKLLLKSEKLGKFFFQAAKRKHCLQYSAFIENNSALQQLSEKSFQLFNYFKIFFYKLRKERELCFYEDNKAEILLKLDELLLVECGFFDEVLRNL